METTNEILDSASHDCPLVTQTYGAAVTTGTHVPSSPTRLGKGCAAGTEVDVYGPCEALLPPPPALSPGRCPEASCWQGWGGGFEADLLVFLSKEE